MFVGQPETYKLWAQTDQQFVKYYGSTGVYPCYCKQLSTSEVNTICSQYLWHFGGGQRGSIPVGVTTGMLNQLGSTLVLQFTPLLNFSSTQKKNSLSVVLIFFLYYYNMVLLPLILSKDYGVK